MDARKRRILLAIAIPLAMVGIDGTILNVALPTIAEDLDTTSSELVWINCQPTNPAWFHNLMANPETTVQVGGEVREVSARVGSDEERERLWPRFVATYPAYDFYEQNAPERRIPVVILERR